MTAGGLFVVGTGILPIGHCSAEAKRAIEGADIVLAQAGDALSWAWLQSLNANTLSLAPFYDQQTDRRDAYAAMADAIMREVRKGLRVCAVFYGHPGVFVSPSARALTLARQEGYEAQMLPAISAEDCLFADLELDPALYGCQSYEARDFYLNQRTIDTSAALILWQIAVTGDASFQSFVCDGEGVGGLAALLMQTYPASHQVVLYRAATLPIVPPHIERLELSRLGEGDIDQATTLYVPPLGPPMPRFREAKAA